MNKALVYLTIFCVLTAGLVNLVVSPSATPRTLRVMARS